MASQPGGIVNRDHGRTQPARALFYMIAPFRKADLGGVRLADDLEYLITDISFNGGLQIYRILIGPTPVAAIHAVRPTRGSDVP
jgi:hypothetical protein